MPPPTNDGPYVAMRAIHRHAAVAPEIVFIHQVWGECAAFHDAAHTVGKLDNASEMIWTGVILRIGISAVHLP